MYLYKLNWKQMMNEIDNIKMHDIYKKNDKKIYGWFVDMTNDDLEFLKKNNN